ncbi:MAG: NADH-quinone oxidoreductase subunit NuoH [Anaerolineae bacterium]|nr:NADH-quinone oxidoreductase subunit NuoH [Anaerolineae bacterium]MCO5191454.1 NADH-quinone oxidoreductase subunit NuoH [Anaerolineae bacterium]MCO5192218.1 NADH-quinone oxidoreductase subunit NuoH [Anaerolineae bacterium]MCO5198348.1 NADH-quinone oxidoreductase subunit NuoH [Anaerolineae bacterium]MCO5204100.1 NADH-quinone oxidoreductase subunit NuoH [Anaerolineae bacterium]
MNPIDLLIATLQLRLGEYLVSVYGSENWVFVVRDVLTVLTISTFCLLIVIFLIWLERKVIARMQDRLGPNRVGGRYGLLQTVADVLKLLTKESLTPAGADKWAYNLAPLLIVMTALLMWAVIPFGPGAMGADLNIGVFYILAVSSVSVVCLLLAGWGSNNKYALLGAFRSVAQLVSYEVPMVLSLLIPIILAGSMATEAIIGAQYIPFLFVIPLSAVIFFISALAETGRTPFDLLEAESEIVAGFHVEYGGMKFGMFFLAEFIGTLLMSALFVTIYWGGYTLPLVNLVLGVFGLPPIDLASLAWGRTLSLPIFFGKVFVIYFVFIWIRATLPRVRIDQMLNLNWKFLVPLSLVLILVVAIVDKALPANTNVWAYSGIMLLANILIAVGAIELLRRRGRQERAAAEAAHDDELADISAEALPAAHH